MGSRGSQKPGLENTSRIEDARMIGRVSFERAENAGLQNRLVDKEALINRKTLAAISCGRVVRAVRTVVSTGDNGRDCPDRRSARERRKVRRDVREVETEKWSCNCEGVGTTGTTG